MDRPDDPAGGFDRSTAGLWWGGGRGRGGGGEGKTEVCSHSAASDLSALPKDNIHSSGTARKVSHTMAG